MRAIWTGAVSFGLVNVPVRLYSATTNHDIRFHQVHEADGGRIRYKRTCSVCGEEVDYADIVKGYETDDGQLVMLDDEDLASLPTATGHEIDVVEFVPADQVDPLLMDKSYYLEPENKAVKPYVLLREALRATDRMAVVKVALRQRETLALLRVRDKAIVLQTMLWPDEVRAPDFETLRTEVELRPQELDMASSLVDSLGADFDPTAFEDEYKAAVEELLVYKAQHGEGRPAPAETAGDDGEAITDLLTALRRSVEAAGGSAPAEPAATPQKAPAKRASTKTPATKTPATKTPATKTPATKTPATKTPATKTASNRAAKPAAAKTPAGKGAGPATSEAQEPTQKAVRRSSRRTA